MSVLRVRYLSVQGTETWLYMALKMLTGLSLEA